MPISCWTVNFQSWASRDRGPSLSIQTSCSTSLVAVHVACQHLLMHQCDVALAGGVFLGRLPVTGYLWQPGGILSPDGHCRAFDAGAQGAEHLLLHAADREDVAAESDLARHRDVALHGA